MMDLPRHPDASNGGESSDHRPPEHKPWWPYALVIVIGALFVLMVVLHFAGVMGPSSH
jgi:hypothetical protein